MSSRKCAHLGCTSIAMPGAALCGYHDELKEERREEAKRLTASILAARTARKIAREERND